MRSTTLFVGYTALIMVPSHPSLSASLLVSAIHLILIHLIPILISCITIHFSANSALTLVALLAQDSIFLKCSSFSVLSP